LVDARRARAVPPPCSTGSARIYDKASGLPLFKPDLPVDRRDIAIKGVDPGMSPSF